MEFEIVVSHIREAVSRVFDVSPSKTQEGASVGVRILAESEGTVSFIVNDTTLVARAVCDAEVKQPGEAVVSLTTLFKAVTGFSPLKDGRGTEYLRVKKGSQSLYLAATTMYSTRSVKQRRVISFLDTSISDLKIVSSDLFVTLPDIIMLEALRSILVSTDAGGPDSNGVSLTFMDKRFRVTSMSGVSLTEYGRACPVNPEYSKCVLDSSFCSKLVKILSRIAKSGEGPYDLKLLITDKMFLFEVDRFMVGTSVLVKDFPNYSSIIEKTRKSFVVHREILLDNLRNVMFNSDKDDDFRVSLKFFDKHLLVSTPSCENEGIPLEGNGEGDLHIDFNIYLLESCVRNFQSDYVSISYRNKNAPVILAPQGGELDYSLFTILAPLK